MSGLTFEEAKLEAKEYAREKYEKLQKEQERKKAERKEYKNNKSEIRKFKRYIKKNVCPNILCRSCVGYGGVDSECPLRFKNRKNIEVLREVYAWAGGEQWLKSF